VECIFVKGKIELFSLRRGVTIRPLMSNKDTRLNLRISSDLKNRVEEIAAREGRSAAQITEVFIKLGIHQYENKGSAVLQQWISRDKRTAKGD
jgi:predicted DNA binding CopG/RHH family protein